MENRNDEPNLEPGAPVSDFESRLGEAWTHQAEGRPGPALELIQDLKRTACSLPRRQDHFITEVDSLERTLALPGACQEIRRLLADAGRLCRGGKPSLTAQPLEEAKRLLLRLPDGVATDLHEEFQRLDDEYQALRRPALERFNVLMETFYGKIAARIGDLRRLSNTDNPVPPDVLRNLLDQVLVAQGILASLDPALIGCRDHEAAARRIAGLRGVLIEHLQGNNGGDPRVNPERAAAPSAPGAAAPPPPAPASEEQPWKLSSWATGTWGASFR